MTIFRSRKSFLSIGISLIAIALVLVPLRNFSALNIVLIVVGIVFILFSVLAGMRHHTS